MFLLWQRSSWRMPARALPSLRSLSTPSAPGEHPAMPWFHPHSELPHCSPSQSMSMVRSCCDWWMQLPMLFIFLLIPSSLPTPSLPPSLPTPCSTNEDENGGEGCSCSRPRLRYPSTHPHGTPLTLKVCWKCWYFLPAELSGTHHVLEWPTGTIYNAVLGMVDIVRGTNSYYKLQLLEADKGKDYNVFRAWGRVGTTIGGNKIEVGSHVHTYSHQLLIPFHCSPCDTRILGIVGNQPLLSSSVSTWRRLGTVGKIGQDLSSNQTGFIHWILTMGRRRSQWVWPNCLLQACPSLSWLHKFRT